MPSLNTQFLDNLQDNFNKYPVFIETGTYNGGTIFTFEQYFNKLYTIELSEKYYYNTKSKYSGNKIQFILGDSTNVFLHLLPNIKNNTIFFLDGHWSSDDTAKGNKDCPLIEEITHINNLFTEEAIIIIDDARLFETKNNEDWSDINSQKIINIIKSRISKVYYLDSECAKNDRLIIHINKI